MITNDELANRHAYHPPRDEETKQHHELIRNKTLDLAMFFNSELPECQEKDLALEHVRTAMMYANAAVAIHGDEL